MIGQEQLWQKLISYSPQTFPKTLLLLGAEGCGKHHLSSLLAQYFKCPLIEITSETTAEQLIDFQYSPVNTFYLINLTNFTEKQQNQFLKFIEEPSSTEYIILIAESEIGILSTILNRCIKYYFKQYSKQNLIQILGYEINDEILQLCNTPGQLQNIDIVSLEKLYQVMDKFITSILEESLDNLCSYNQLLNYKENYNRFEVELFLKSILYKCLTYYSQTKNEFYFKLYQYTNQYKQKLLYKIKNKENIILNYLLNLKENLVYGNNSR